MTPADDPRDGQVWRAVEQRIRELERALADSHAREKQALQRAEAAEQSARTAWRVAFK